VPVRPGRPSKTWGADPEVRAFTEQTEIPDSFPAASEFRRAGYSTYLAILRMPLEELEALEDRIGPDVIRAILALRETPGGRPLSPRG
jgi:hypothetical protein